MHNENYETVEVMSTHMILIPRVVCQAHELDQWEMDDIHFSVGNHISLDQASQIPGEII